MDNKTQPQNGDAEWGRVGTVSYIGKTTFQDIVKASESTVNLFESVARKLAKQDGVSLPDGPLLRIPAVTVYDGEEYDTNAPWSHHCTETCATDVPVFFGSLAPIIFICRGCGVKACWRHTVTDKTGGWCLDCREKAA